MQSVHTLITTPAFSVKRAGHKCAIQHLARSLRRFQVSGLTTDRLGLRSVSR
jgi:hypothetical protein